jgi:hypothetical protein
MSVEVHQHLYGRSINQARSDPEEGSEKSPNMEATCPREHWLTFSGLHGVTSQKTELSNCMFISSVTAINRLL